MYKSLGSNSRASAFTATEIFCQPKVQARKSVPTSSGFFGYTYLFLLIFTCSDRFIVPKLMCYGEESISLIFLFEAASYRFRVPRRAVRGIVHA